MAFEVVAQLLRLLAQRPDFATFGLVDNFSGADLGTTLQAVGLGRIGGTSDHTILESNHYLAASSLGSIGWGRRFQLDSIDSKSLEDRNRQTDEVI